jgi:hypothetical protein
MPGPILGQGGRHVGQTGGEILPAHDYRNEEKRWCRLHPGSILFRLVAPPLQPGVVGTYPVRGVWFHSHLLLVGTGQIHILGYNRWPAVPGVLDPNKWQAYFSDGKGE